MAKVFIGVGHGGSDPGAVANGFEEADLNLSIALACRDVLTAHGVTVRMSRTKDENDALTEEIKECNAFAPDYAIDIHNNKFVKPNTGDGAEIYHSVFGGAGKELAERVLEAIVKETGQNSRGLKTRFNSSGNADYYGFIRETNAPAIIVECAFIDNIKDLQIIDTAAEQKAMGAAIAHGTLKKLGISIKEGGAGEMTKAEIEKLVDEKIKASKEPVYRYFSELPEWAEKPIRTLYEEGYFTGASAGNLNLGQTKLECLVVVARILKERGIINY